MPQWNNPPAHPVLNPDDVHVWLASLDLHPSEVQRHAKLLAPDERVRAERYAFDADRDRYIAGRGILREILGSYLQLDPKLISFSYGTHGKPALEDALGLSFNLAHSVGLALYAITRDAEVGIDVECIRGDLAETLIAEQFFAPGECAALRARPKPEQLTAFFHCWTRKEAFVKANGLGLSFELDEFEVSLKPDEPALLSVRGDSAEAFRWSMHSFSPREGYAAAVAIARRSNAFKYFCVR